MASMDEFKTIISSFEILPKYEDEDENIFSISGFPHYEKVSSNILSFYIDKTREHKLNDLFIKSLFDLLQINVEYLSTQFEIETEVQTKKGNFIDILIYSKEVSIIIENKIYANLYNDLNDYYHHIKDNLKCKNVFGIVLSLKDVNVNHKNFISITYNEYFKRIEINLKDYMYNSNTKYFIYLLEFMSNIRAVAEGEKMNIKLIEFIKDNKDAVLDLNRELKSLHDDFRRLVKKVNNIINEKYQNKMQIKQWPWRELPDFFDIAVTDIYLNNINICLHTTISLNGWEFEIWERSKTGSENLIEEMLKGKNIEYKKGNRSFIINTKFDISEDLELVANHSLDLINNIVNEIGT